MPEEKLAVTNYQQWKQFLESPAWKELKGEVIAYLTDIINPAPVTGGLDDLIERGVNQRIQIALERFFFELPEEMLKDKAQVWEEGDDVDRWLQDGSTET